MLNRRSMLVATGLVAGAVATGAALPTLTSSALAKAKPTDADIPEMLAHRVQKSGVELRRAETTFPLTHLAARWNGASDSAGLRVRTDSGWSDWREIRACHAAPDHRGFRSGALLALPGAVGYELKTADGAAIVTELNAVDGPKKRKAASVRAEVEIGAHATSAQYLSRAAWGADEDLRFKDGVENWPLEWFSAQALTVHHSAGINDDPDPAATVRAIYYYHCVTQDWGDVGYQLLIDEAGRVYEGRVSGDDSVPVYGQQVDGKGSPLVTNGGHVTAHNAGNIGVCLLGDFTDRAPSEAARDSLTRVLALLAKVSGLDPEGTTNYVNPVNGKAKTVRTISGHRDWLDTECPGENFYPMLEELREDVADELS
ncbi:MAG: N-acetylmuramoyl-L-alanine amidase [Corynebacteriales bacterium]|nr:N-acetylmuramoyl-L-alanine amidase [Mycobacteriales bacterium]